MKELIEKLDRKLDTFMHLLHGKADTTAVAALESRVDSVQRDLAALTQREAVQEKHEVKSTEWKRWAIGTAVAALLVVVTAVSVLLSVH